MRDIITELKAAAERARAEYGRARAEVDQTEAALRRARELGLTKDDPMIAKCIAYMEKLALRVEPYPDRIETHKDNMGGVVGGRFGVLFLCADSARRSPAN